MHKEHLFVIILSLFAVWTGLVGLCNEAQAGVITLDNLGSLSSGTIPGQISANIGATSGGSSTIIPIDNFTSSFGYNLSSVYFSNTLFSSWNQQNGIGLVLSDALGLQSVFEIRGVQPNQNGDYDVVYVINNSVNSPFSVFSAINEYSTPYLWVQFSQSDVEVEVYPTDTGINPRSTMLFSSSYWYPSTVSTVETIFSPSQNNIKVIINAGTAVEFSQIVPLPADFKIPASPASTINYAGVSAYNSGFTVKSITAPIQTSIAASSGGPTGIGVIDAIIGGITNFIGALIGFAGIIGGVIGLSAYPAVPFAVWAVLGLPLIAGLLYMGFELFRGTG